MSGANSGAPGRVRIAYLDLTHAVVAFGAAFLAGAINKGSPCTRLPKPQKSAFDTSKPSNSASSTGCLVVFTVSVIFANMHGPSNSAKPSSWSFTCSPHPSVDGFALYGNFYLIPWDKPPPSPSERSSPSSSAPQGFPAPSHASNRSVAFPGCHDPIRGGMSSFASFLYVPDLSARHRHAPHSPSKTHHTASRIDRLTSHYMKTTGIGLTMADHGTIPGNTTRNYLYWFAHPGPPEGVAQTDPVALPGLLGND